MDEGKERIQEVYLFSDTCTVGEFGGVFRYHGIGYKRLEERETSRGRGNRTTHLTEAWEDRSDGSDRSDGLNGSDKAGQEYREHNTVKEGNNQVWGTVFHMERGDRTAGWQEVAVVGMAEQEKTQKTYSNLP